MKIRQLWLVGGMLGSLIPAWGAEINLPALHQDGRYLKDDQGNTVNLYGVMDTPNWWFNRNNDKDGWALDWNNGQYNSELSLKNCLAYFNRMVPALHSPENGTYCNVLRLHLDPAWTNDPDKEATNGGNENDISRFSLERLKSFFERLYWPIAQKALESGMYVIMRPPGVCPHDISVGGDYYNYLMTVWGYLSSHPTLQQYAGQVSFELANEPIQILDKQGERTDVAPHDFFQPIVNKIRANGFKGILWVPGEGYQSQYQKYQQYPISDTNFGYAVHYYPGWYNTQDDYYDPLGASTQFHVQVPVVDNYPIVVTEIDWSPMLLDDNGKPVVDHVNEMGQTSYKNWGTWGTAHTSTWGNEFKYIWEKYGNVSMTIEGSGLYLDIDHYMTTGGYRPAFSTMPKPEEACGVAAWNWYKEWTTGEKPSEEHVVDNSLFSLNNGTLNPNIWEQGRYEYDWDAKVGMLTLGQYGFGGWRSAEGFDVSAYKRITVTLAEPRYGEVSLRVFTDNNYWGTPIQAAFNGTTTATIDLSEIDRLYIVGLWDYGNTDLDHPTNVLKIKSVKLERINDLETGCFDFGAMNFASAGKSPQWDATTGIMNTASVTDQGWAYSQPQDWSEWQYLVMVQQEPDLTDAQMPVGLKISDGVYDFYDTSMRFFRWNAPRIGVLDLKTIRSKKWEDDKTYPDFNLRSIRRVYFDAWWGGREDMSIAALYLTNTKPNMDGDYVIANSEAGHFRMVCLPYNAACCGARVYEMTNSGLTQHVGLLKAGVSYLVRSNSTDAVRFYRAGAYQLSEVETQRMPFIGQLRDVILGKVRPFGGKDSDANALTIGTLTEVVGQ